MRALRSGEIGPSIRTMVLACLVAGIANPTRGVQPNDEGFDSTGIASHRRTMEDLNTLWRDGPIDSFWRSIDHNLEAARAAPDTAAYLDLLAMRGRARARLSLANEAEPDLRAAIDLAAKLDSSGVERASLRWLAYALQRQGRSDEAVLCYQRLLALSREGGDADHEGWALAGIAYWDWRSGRPQEAKEGYARARELFRKVGDRDGEAFASNGIGTAFQDLGRYEDAIASYEAAASIARSIRATWMEGLAANNMAVVLYSLGDPGEARSRFVRALELQRQSGDLAEAALTAVNVANCDIALGRLEDAVATITQAQEDCRRHGVADLDAHLRNSMADIRCAQDRFHAAAALYRRNLSGKGTADARERVEALTGLSQVLVRLDSLPAATLLLENAAPWVARIANREAQLDYQLELGRRLFDSGRSREALATLDRVAREAGRLDLKGPRMGALCAAAYAARAIGAPDRALDLTREAVAVWEADRRLPIDPEWREIRSAAAGEIAVLRGALLLDDRIDLAPEERAKAAFDSLQVFKARTLLERMQGPIDTLFTPTMPVTAAELQVKWLHAGELLLDFYVGRTEGILFAVTNTECRAARLPDESTLDDVIDLYLRMISDRSSPSRSATPAAGRSREELFHNLLGPVRDMIVACRSVIVAPDGVLHRMNFATLLAESPSAGPSPDAVDPPVIQVVPSATTLKILREGASRHGQISIPVRVLALLGAENDRRERLFGADAEIRDISEKYRDVSTTMPGVSNEPGDSISVGPESDGSVSARRNTAAALASMRGFSLLHLATHATVDDEHPWRSKILLGASRGRALTLTASDISRARLDARLAVLSTCRSGGGRLISGEGVQSLAGAFLAAGVPSVVASLWPVDDRATWLLMRAFYSSLSKGETVAEALGTAQRTLRSRPDTRDPFDWAGFVVIGDGSLKVPLRRNRLSVDAPAVLILLGGVALLLWGARSRRGAKRGRL